jgi:thioredoxin reductase
MQVCVIGAGAAGLTAAKHLLEKNFEVELLEKRDGLGGLWYFSKDATGVSSATTATSSKTYLQFSDFPFDKEIPHFPHHTDYLKYLKRYAEKHKILPLIKYNREVLSLKKSGKGWEITVRHGNETYTEFKDAVVVSSGIHHIPLIPEIPGKEKYTGLQTHSGLLKSGEDIKGKRVAVMGIGESGADFAHYLTEFADEVYLSMRRGVVVTPRWAAPEMPADFDSTRAKVWLPREFLHDYQLGCYPGFPDRQYSAFRTFFTLLGLPVWLLSLPVTFKSGIDFILSLFDWKMWAALFQPQKRHGDASGIELSKACAELCKEPPKTEAEAEEKYWRLMSTFEWHSGAIHNAQTFTKSSDFLKDIVAGKVKVVPGISRYNGGTEVEFEDGTKKDIDTVVMCTGYHAILPFLQEGEMDNRHLYKHVFIPGESTLAFIGFARPNIGALPPLTEMQARWFARVLAGEVTLPNTEEMKRTAASDGEYHSSLRKGYAQRLYITATVDYQLYLNELAGYVGCRPQLLQLLGHPKLLFAVLFGPFASFQYRLHGDSPNWEAAMKVVGDLPPYPIERVVRDIGLLLLVKPWFVLLGKLGFKRFEPVL